MLVKRMNQGTANSILPPSLPPFWGVQKFSSLKLGIRLSQMLCRNFECNINLDLKNIVKNNFSTTASTTIKINQALKEIRQYK